MIGDKILELRNQNNLTQSELAKKLNCAIGTISQYENNKRTPDANLLKHIADLFGKSIDYFFDNNSDLDKKQTANNLIKTLDKITDSNKSTLSDAEGITIYLLKKLISTGYINNLDNIDDDTTNLLKAALRIDAKIKNNENYKDIKE